ncbi:MAG: cytochrome-c oxidase, cbb3-type subunit III [Azoarcus sp.]|jgi:cytochrome c oxidase cbb3-type subunit 3|nr:cytochrome-c oxidase, cbb3-type subunit III [Azoarcus sp.]
MADFISGFWNLYVSGLIAFGLLFCLVVLVTNTTSQGAGEPKLQGHVWDENLREYNNPLPRWWLYLFWVTVIFAIFYFYLFPGFGDRHSDPSNPAKERGLRAEYAKEVNAANAKYGPTFERYLGTDLKALASDPAAVATGKRLFLTYCSQCHGSAARGAQGKNYGFPNLTDDDWLYGGDPETIKASIEGGRAGVMTAFGGTLNSDQIRDVANYVRAIAGLTSDAARAARGRDVFASNCTVCHGPEGKGARSMGEAFAVLGAPDLTDGIWLYSSTEEAIVDGVTKGRNAGPGSVTNTMPAWKDFLGDAKVHILAAYVHSLGSNK